MIATYPTTNLKSKVLMSIFLSFCCVLFSTISLQAEEYTVTWITDNNLLDTNPQIHNGQVIWMGEDGHDFEIYLYDGNQTIQFTNNDHYDNYPQIHNGQVTWMGSGGLAFEIYFYDGTQTIQLTNNFYMDSDPQIHNGQVTWIGYDGNDYEIYLYDGTQTIQLTNNDYDDNYPQIHNGKVTWSSYDGNDYEIYLYDGTQTIQLTNNDYYDNYSQIHNGQVTWIGYDGHDSEIYLYDGTQTIRLTNNFYNDYFPQIHNGKVTWMGYDGHDVEIYFHDGTQTIRLTNNYYHDYSPQISNGQVTWYGYDGNDYEIYLYDGAQTIRLTNNYYHDYYPQIHNGKVTWYGYDGHDSEIYLARPIATSFSLIEQSFTTETLTETILAQEILFGDVQVSGNLSGTLSFTEFEIVKITTGSFADKGFFTAQWEAVLDQETYNGTYQGAVYPDLEKREIHLKGNISGDLNGIIEDTLAESEPESGIYDTYQARWNLNIQDTYASATLNLEGPVFYGNDSSFISDIYLYQADMKGDAHGYYVGPLDAVLTHLRLNNTPGEYGEYENKGFSMISYATNYASGDGWAYNTSSLPDIEEFEGLLKEPLLGTVSASLDEEAVPKILTGRIEGINLNLYVPNLRVNVWGPQRLSPGQTFNYVIEYRNDGPKDATEAIIYFNLDPYANYISASEGAYHDSYLHQVSWNIGALPAKSSGFLTVQAIIPWGLPWGHSLKSRAIITDIVLHSTFENGCLNGISYNSENYNINRTFEEFVSFNNCTWHPVYIVYDRTNFITGALEAWLALLDVPTSRNGVSWITGNRPKWIGFSGGAATLVNQAKNARISGDVLYVISGQGITQSDLQIAKQQFNKIVVYQGDDPIPNAINFNGIILEPEYFKLYREHIKTISQEILQPPDNNVEDLLLAIESEEGKVVDSLEFYNQEPGNRIKINWADGTWKNFNITNTIEAEDGIEIVPILVEHVDIIHALNKYLEEYGVLPEGGDIEKFNEIQKEFLEEDSSETAQTITVAHDPNEKFVSPEGDIISGELLNYTITYENEGEGTAYGVYVTDTLDEDLNDETLLLDGGVGEYDPETRTITWLVGQVGSGETGAFTFQIEAKDDLPKNTEVLNFATVYFPSVPEATRTNAVVNIANKTDNIPPVLRMPNLDSAYIYNSMLSFYFSASDPESGIASLFATLNGIPIANGDTVELNNLGTNTFYLEATDYEGNTASQSVVFNVQYSFSGFLPPVQANGSKVYQHGRTLPIKFRLQDINQTHVSTAVATITLQQFSNEIPIGDPIEVESTSGADTGNMFRYLGEGQYIFNLSTNALSLGTWQLQAHLDDGTTKTGFIKLK